MDLTYRLYYIPNIEGKSVKQKGTFIINKMNDAGYSIPISITPLKDKGKLIDYIVGDSLFSFFVTNYSIKKQTKEGNLRIVSGLTDILKIEREEIKKKIPFILRRQGDKLLKS